MNNTTNRESVLESIDVIDQIAMESGIDVMASIASSYEKSSMIMENYSGDEIEMFSIFQEAEVEDGDPSGTDADVHKKKDKGLMYKIIHFIPNCIKQLIEFIKRMWNGEIVPAMGKAKDAAGSISDKTKDLFNKIRGKDESWVREHAVELGLSGAALTAVIGFVAYMNKDKIPTRLKDWMNNISVFFKKLTGKYEDKDILWEMDDTTQKIRTNINFRVIVDSYKNTPGMFDALKLDNLKNLNIKDVNSLNSFLKSITADIGKIQSTSENLANTVLITPKEGGEVFEYSYKEFIDMMVDFNAIISTTNDKGTQLSDKIKGVEDKLNEILGEGDVESNPVKAPFKKMWQWFQSFVGLITKAITATVSAIKWLIEKMKGIFTKKKEIDDLLPATTGGSGDTAGSGEGGDDTTDTSGESGDGSTDTDDGSGVGLLQTSDGSDDGGSTDSTDSDAADSTEGSSEKTYNKGDTVTADEALKLLQSTGAFKAWVVKDGKLVSTKNGNEKPVSPGNYGAGGKDIAPGVKGVRINDDGSIVLESYYDLDEDDYMSTGSSWYNM